MSGNDRPRAACLTAPAPGGVAVVRVVGVDAAGLVRPLLRARRGSDPVGMGPDELRLCRVVDGAESIDDVLVSVRPMGGGQVVDLSLHGGARIVQRTLHLLQRQGARLVEPIELLDATWPAAHLIEEDVLRGLLRARTRLAADWLVRMGSRLPAVIERACVRLEQQRHADAAGLLRPLLPHVHQVRYLLDGARVVLAGAPNVGKSSLANALARREHAIVSETPGTTRDWVEHPAAIDGVPFTFVDTAGLRATADPIEEEAIRRTCQQMGPSDLVLRVVDLSRPPAPAERQAVQAGLRADRGPGRTTELLVWNKADLPAHPEQASLIRQADPRAPRVSAVTGAGLDDLRGRLLALLGLADGFDGVTAVFTERQRLVVQQALSVLTRPEPACEEARAALGRLTGQGSGREGPA